MNANLQNKIEVVNEIRDKVSRAKSVVFVEYKGTTVSQDTSLRANFRKDGTEYKVYKNKLILKALNEQGITGCDDYLQGTTAVAFNYDDEVLAAKAIAEAQKDNQSLQFKFGIQNGQVVDAEYVKKLSSIPSKEVLLTQIATMLQAPIRNLACTIKAVAEK